MPPHIRLGLCCTFSEQPIKFRSTTVTHLAKIGRDAALEKLSDICRQNALALMEALRFCATTGIGCFRINSGLLPCATHGQVGYALNDLPDGPYIKSLFEECGAFAASSGIRTCFHPDQFVVLNSARPEVVDSSIKELDHQAEMASWVGADVINVHAGSSQGGKEFALSAFAKNFLRLGKGARDRLTVENDDKVYTPSDLLPVCLDLGLPLVYDAHHHKCNPDGLSVAEASRAALETWDREPLFHISSPKNGWEGASPISHSDFIDPLDFPDCWRESSLIAEGCGFGSITVEVEAKAKELAVLQLMNDLRGT
jgi:UV DNA damage endonuclease